MPYSLPAHHHHRSNPHILAPPRRRRHSRSPVFHFTQDQDDDRDDDSPDETIPPPLKLNPNPSLRLSLDPDVVPRDDPFPFQDPPAAIPFPRSSPSLDSPPVARSISQPVLLANGKPLKSSLKSSSSTPNISHSPRTIHHRARSAPSTPDALAASAPKNVHFAEKDGLATVRVFNRSAKPASLSRSLLTTVAADDTETETESEFGGRSIPGAFPFPRIPTTSSSPIPQTAYELDHTIPGATSAVPAENPSIYANVHLESIHLEPAAHKQPPLLTGTLLVRNVAYEKLVAVRFTLDDWQTTSEVLARHVLSLPSGPSFILPRTTGDVVAVLAGNEYHAWDRFAFTIRLEDYAHKLHERVMWLVARFTAPAGEWWDNNAGSNYRVAFRVVSTANGNASKTTTVSHTRSLSAPAHFTPVSADARHRQAEQDTRRFSLSTPPSSPTAAAATHRLSKLSLKNYAAPAQRPPASTLMTPPATPQEDSTVATATATAPSPKLHTLLGTSESLSSSILGSHHDMSKPTIIGGHPVSYVSPGTGGHEHAKGNTTAGGGRGKVNGATPFGGLGPGFGIGGITLHWPWGNAGSAGIEAGPDEAEVLADFKPVEENGRGDDGDGGCVSEKESEREERVEESEGNSSSSSSSVQSSDETTTKNLGAKAMNRKSVGIHPGRNSPPRSPTFSAPEGRNGNGNRTGSTGRRMSPPPSLSQSFGVDLDRDSAYNAFVKQWCFAQGPPPTLGGSGGLVVG